MAPPPPQPSVPAAKAYERFIASFAGAFRVTGRAYRARLWREDVRAIEEQDVDHIVDRMV